MKRFAGVEFVGNGFQMFSAAVAVPEAIELLSGSSQSRGKHFGLRHFTVVKVGHGAVGVPNGFCFW